MITRIFQAAALALLLLVPSLPAQAAEPSGLVLAQADAQTGEKAGTPGESAGDKGWAVRRKVVSPGEANGNLPPAQQQAIVPGPPKADAPPLALPEPSLPREPAKGLSGKPLDQTREKPQATPAAPVQKTAPAPSPAQKAAPAPAAKPAPSPAPKAAPKPAPAPAAAPTPPQNAAPTATPPGTPPTAAPVGVPAGPPSTANMVPPPVKTPAPEADAPTPLRPAPAKPALRKGAASVAVRRAADELHVTISTGGPVDFETFFLENPSRMIVDINGDWAIRGAHELAVGSHGCRSVRLGRHEDKLRAVFDLDPGSVHRTETTRTPTGLRVIFSK